MRQRWPHTLTNLAWRVLARLQLRLRHLLMCDEVVAAEGFEKVEVGSSPRGFQLPMNNSLMNLVKTLSNVLMPTRTQRIEFGPVRNDSVRRWAPPLPGSNPPCAGSRRHGLLPGVLVIACNLSFIPSSLKWSKCRRSSPRELLLGNAVVLVLERRNEQLPHLPLLRLRQQSPLLLDSSAW